MSSTEQHKLKWNGPIPELPLYEEIDSTYLTLSQANSYPKHDYVNTGYTHLEKPNRLLAQTWQEARYTDLPTLQKCQPPTKQGVEAPPQAHEKPSKHIPNSYYVCTIVKYVAVPEQIKQRLTDLAERRDMGFVKVDAKGGVFEMFQPQHDEDLNKSIVLMIPRNSVVEPFKIVVIKSENCKDFPRNIPKENTLSDVIHLLPHNKEFQKPITVKIPLKKSITSQERIRIMYSDSDTGVSNPHWRILKARRSNLERNTFDWYIAENSVFLKVTHFCMFVVVEEFEKETKQVLPLRACLQLEYKPRLSCLTVVVSFDENIQEAKVKRNKTTHLKMI